MVGAGPRRPFLADQEHRHLGPVLRRVEALLDADSLGIESQLRRRPGAFRAARRIEAIDGRRAIEAGESEEGLGVVGAAVEAARGADSRQRHGRNQLAVEIMDPGLALGVDEVGGDDLAADQACAIERLLGLGNDGRGRDRRRCDVDRHDLLERRTLVGLEEEAAAVVADPVPLVLEAGEDRPRLGPWLLEVDDVDVVLVARLAGVDDQPAAVVGHVGRVEQLGLAGGRIDQSVARLRHPQLVEVDSAVEGRLLEGLALLRRREARIIKAAAVLGPGDRARIFEPLELVGADLSGGGVHDLDRAPVGAAVLDRISEQLAVLARSPFGERGGAVGRPAIGVDQHPPGPSRPSRTNSTDWFWRPVLWV